MPQSKVLLLISIFTIQSFRAAFGLPEFVFGRGFGWGLLAIADRLPQ